MMPAFAQYIHLAARVKPDNSAHAAPTKAKLTKAEKLAYVKRWRQSGMERGEFSQACGISKNALSKWEREA